MDNYNNFARRHIGLNQSNIDDLLSELGYKNLEDFSKAVLPENIFIREDLKMDEPMT